MRQILLLFLILFSCNSFASEWKNLKHYQKETGKAVLSPSHWLHKDRVQNTAVWHKANVFNLKNNFFVEYRTIQERTSFYKWYAVVIEDKKHEVVWPKMAYFISGKLYLTNRFPYSTILSKDVQEYSYKGSEAVFNAAFIALKDLFFAPGVLKGAAALQWDKTILYKEQYVWLAELYSIMDKKTLKRLTRIAKGKFFYGLLVPKPLRFSGELSNSEDRYSYALDTLRKYCKNTYY